MSGKEASPRCLLARRYSTILPDPAEARVGTTIDAVVDFFRRTLEARDSFTSKIRISTEPVDTASSKALKVILDADGLTDLELVKFHSGLESSSYGSPYVVVVDVPSGTPSEGLPVQRNEVSNCTEVLAAPERHPGLARSALVFVPDYPDLRLPLAPLSLPSPPAGSELSFAEICSQAEVIAPQLLAALSPNSSGEARPPASFPGAIRVHLLAVPPTVLPCSRVDLVVPPSTTVGSLRMTFRRVGLMDKSPVEIVRVSGFRRLSEDDPNRVLVDGDVLYLFPASEFYCMSGTKPVETAMKDFKEYTSASYRYRSEDMPFSTPPRLTEPLPDALDALLDHDATPEHHSIVDGGNITVLTPEGAFDRTAPYRIRCPEKYVGITTAFDIEHATREQPKKPIKVVMRCTPEDTRLLLARNIFALMWFNPQSAAWEVEDRNNVEVLYPTADYVRVTLRHFSLYRCALVPEGRTLARIRNDRFSRDWNNPNQFDRPYPCGGKNYYVPQRFQGTALTLPGAFPEDDPHGFHGTWPAAAVQMCLQGFRLPGSVGRVEPGHIPLGRTVHGIADFANACFLSPSFKLAGAYGGKAIMICGPNRELWVVAGALNGNGNVIITLLQARIRRNTFQEVPNTIALRNWRDPHYDNAGIEYRVASPGDITIYRILERELTPQQFGQQFCT